MKHLTSGVSCIHWMVTPEAQILLRFALRPAIFETQGCRKSEMHRMTQNNLKHLTVKSTLHTLNTNPKDPNFTPFRSTIASFPENWVFLFIHRLQWWIWYFGKKILKNQKPKISKIANLVLWGPFGKKIQEKFRIQEDFRLRFVGGVVFWNFRSHWVPC